MAGPLLSPLQDSSLPNTDISQEDEKMPASPAHFCTARGLCQALGLLLLAGCGARAVHEQQPPALPGGGTYTWETSRIEALPEVPGRSAADAENIRAAIDNGLGNRGYLQRPETEAAWRVSYRTSTETRKEKFAPDDRMLMPRMVCGLHDCSIRHEWVHFGPPRHGPNPEYEVAKRVVQVAIHDSRTGLLVWQGKVASELGESGQPDMDALRRQMNRLLRTLPPARQKRLSRAPTPAAAPAPAPASTPP